MSYFSSPSAAYGAYPFPAYTYASPSIQGFQSPAEPTSTPQFLGPPAQIHTSHYMPSPQQHADIFGGHAHEFTSTLPAEPSSSVRRDAASPYPVVSRRQRVAMACTYCRKRKIRCDGLDTCTNCVRARRGCHYAPVPPEVNKTRPPRPQARPLLETKSASFPLESSMYDFQFTASPLSMAAPWSPQEANFAFQPSASTSSLMPPISISPAHVHPHASAFTSPPSLTRSSSPDDSSSQSSVSRAGSKRGSTDSHAQAFKRPRIEHSQSSLSLHSPPYTPHMSAQKFANPQLLTPVPPFHYGRQNPNTLFTPSLTPAYKSTSSPDLAHMGRFPQPIKMNGPIGLGISMPEMGNSEDVFRAQQGQFVRNMVYPTA